MTRLAPFSVILLLGLVSCGLFGGAVNARSADYYNVLAGVNIKLKYTSFLSPELLKSMQPEDLGKLEKVYAKPQRPNSRSSKVLPKDVYVAQAGRFAITVVSASLGRPYTTLKPVRWVKVGSKWYLYLSTSYEIEAYGYFPQDLQPPSPVAGGALGIDTGDATASRTPKPEDEEAFGGNPPPEEPETPPAPEPEPPAAGAGEGSGGGSSDGMEPLPVPGQGDDPRGS